MAAASGDDGTTEVPVVPLSKPSYFLAPGSALFQPCSIYHGRNLSPDVSPFGSQ